VNSGSETVNVIQASREVLAAVPQMNSGLAQRVIAERMKQRFAGIDDLVKRIPELTNSVTINYLTADPPIPSMIVSRATVAGSGISRTVRLLFKRQTKTQIVLYAPLIYKKTVESKFDRWRFD
jgi:hypothetical protein